MKNWDTLIIAAENGHEIANHTKTHPHLGGMTKEQQNTELNYTTSLINQKITTQKCVTMAYPYCELGNDSICKSLFIASRGCQGFIDTKSPSNIQNVSSIICGFNGSVKTVANFKSKANAAALSSGWLVYLIHGIDKDGGYSDLSSDTLRGSLEYLKNNPDKFWVTTFGNAARYVRERNCLKVQEISNVDNLITLNVTDTLDNSVFNLPVTLRRLLPDGWTAVSCSQNDVVINSSVVQLSTKKYIVFDALPDGGEVKLMKIDNTAVSYSKTGINRNIWLSNGNLNFTIDESVDRDLSVSIFNIYGQLIKQVTSFNRENGNGVVCLTQGSFTPGIYIIKLQNSLASWSGKIQL